MKECKIILPASGDPESLRQVERCILSAFGGYTKSFSQGVWIDYAGIAVCEDVLVYVIATDDDTHLAQIALDARINIGETSVYIKYCNGDVELV